MSPLPAPWGLGPCAPGGAGLSSSPSLASCSVDRGPGGGHARAALVLSGGAEHRPGSGGLGGGPVMGSGPGPLTRARRELPRGRVCAGPVGELTGFPGGPGRSGQSLRPGPAFGPLPSQASVPALPRRPGRPPPRSAASAGPLLSGEGGRPERRRALSTTSACAPPSTWAWDQAPAPLALVCSSIKWGSRLRPAPRVFEGGAGTQVSWSVSPVWKGWERCWGAS